MFPRCDNAENISKTCRGEGDDTSKQMRQNVCCLHCGREHDLHICSVCMNKVMSHLNDTHFHGVSEVEKNDDLMAPLISLLNKASRMRYICRAMRIKLYRELTPIIDALVECKHISPILKQLQDMASFLITSQRIEMDFIRKLRHILTHVTWPDGFKHTLRHSKIRFRQKLRKSFSHTRYTEKKNTESSNMEKLYKKIKEMGVSALIKNLPRDRVRVIVQPNNVMRVKKAVAEVMGSIDMADVEGSLEYIILE